MRFCIEKYFVDAIPYPSESCLDKRSLVKSHAMKQLSGGFGAGMTAVYFR